MALGAIIGVATGIGVLTGVDIPGVGSWLVAVAVAKLGFIASFALIAVGAVLRRVAAPPEQLTAPGTASPEPTADRALPSGTAPADPIVQRDRVEQQRRTPL